MAGPHELVSVVLVDDSSEVRGLLRRLLEATGFLVVGEGGDGDEAILLAYRHEPDLMLLDTSMPTADGIEVLPAIIAVSPGTRVVIFTGFEEPHLAARARELGAADLVEKSIALEHLPARLRQVLGANTMPSTPDESGPVDGQQATSSASMPPPLSTLEFEADEQAVLTQHVQQFRELFDRAEIGFATLTSSGTVVRANRALADLMSCTPSELVGVDYGRLTVGKGEDLDRCLDDINSLGTDLSSFEHHLPAPADEEPARIVRVTLSPIRDSDQHVLYIFAQVQDVTAQREVENDLRHSEESLRRLISAVSEYAIFMLDTNGTVVSWNSGAQRIKGYTAAEIIGQNFRIFYPPEDQEAGHPEDNLQLALRLGSCVEEGWRMRRNGSRFWASVVITPVYSDSGQHVGFAKVTRDQSQQRHHEEQRQRLVDEQVHLLAMTAHELRNPIAVIDGSAASLQSARDNMTQAQVDDLLRAIRSGAGRLRRLASDLTSASQLDGEALPLQLRDVSLAEVLGSAVARSQAAGSSSQVQITVDKDAVFQADPDRLAQAVDNLLDNALQHGAGPVGLVGTLNDVVSIKVTDSGPGIPADLVPHLFERLAFAGATGGTGLGLHLVRQIARRHGGDASYHPPRHGEQTTFEIKLPRHHQRSTVTDAAGA